MRVCCDAIRKHADGVQHEIITMYDADRIGAPKMVKTLVGLTNFDLVMFLGDDTVPEPGFLKESVAAMNTFPDKWGLVGLTVVEEADRDKDEAPATHWLAHKKLLDYLDGEFFHTGYNHCFCDNELTERCRELNRFKWAEAARVRHIHPVFKAAAWDDDYLRVYGHENMMHDLILFQTRRGDQWKNV